MASDIEEERERILKEIEWLECADEIETSQGIKEGWTPRMCALTEIFKRIVKNKKRKENVS